MPVKSRQMRRLLPLGLLSAAALCSPAAALLSQFAEPPTPRGTREKKDKPRRRGKKAPSEELVLMHVPYNFGHTVEMAALFPILPTTRGGTNGNNQAASKFTSMNFTWGMVNTMRALKPHAEVWGHFNPDLNGINEVTGCPMYYTPPKYWPKDLAKKYFGNKTSFGMLRDPYERLNSFFRGGFGNYGGAYPEFTKNCDVNGAVQKMMKEVLAKNDPFKDMCTFVPQAEYFDGEYGIKLPIDNRRFPFSLNEVFDKYGYRLHISTNHIAHVRGCDNVWSGDFNKETKRLVKQVYKRDFELLCKHFNYCDDEEEVCIPGVPYMCPLDRFEWNRKAAKFEKKG